MTTSNGRTHGSAAQDIISEIDPNVNPAGVEACMWLQYGTLGHLSRETFRHEIALAKQCEREEPGFLRASAESYGLLRDFERWEADNPLAAHDIIIVRNRK